MSMTLNRLILCAGLVLLLGVGIGSVAAAADEGISLDFKNVAIPDLVKTISELTGKNFILDDSVRGAVTIISPKKMPKEDAYKIFLSVLKMKGYTVIPAGNFNKIVSLRDVREETLPAKTGVGRGGGEEFVTRLVPLQYIDAEMIANSVLKTLLPKSAAILAYAPTNTLIISDTESNIERLYRIIRELDVDDSSQGLEILPVTYADAQELAKIIQQVLTESKSPARGRAQQGAAGEQATKIIPYPRTNSLIVMASAEEMALIRTIIERLDTKTTQDRAGIYVYYLENADAETLAKTLNEIMTGVKAADPAKKEGQAAPAAGNQKVTITSDKSTNSLIVNSTPEDYETIKEIVSKLDIKRKQVFVEALIMELSIGAAQDLGVSLQGAVTRGSDGVIIGSTNLNNSGAGSTGAVAGGLLTQSIEGIMLGGMFNPITTTGPDGSSITIPALSALLHLSETTNDVNVLSAPRLLTTDNEEAEIIVGQNVPIITQRSTDTTNTNANTTNVERKDVALTLRFTPQITEGDLVRMSVYQEITDLASSNVGNVEEVGPTLTKRMLRNTVVAEDTRTIALGGLIANTRLKKVSKVPLLGDIPFLGWLFRRSTEEDRKTTLMIFITPTIIRDSSDLELVTTKNRKIIDSMMEAQENRGKKKGKKMVEVEDAILKPQTEGPEQETAEQGAQNDGETPLVEQPVVPETTSEVQ